MFRGRLSDPCTLEADVAGVESTVPVVRKMLHNSSSDSPQPSHGVAGS